MEYLIAIFGIVFILSGFYLIANARISIKEAAIANNWPVVQGKIIRSKVIETYGEGTTFYHAEIEYEYRVKGTSYSNDEISIGGEERTSNRGYIAAICKKYPINSIKKSFTTRMIPKNPILTCQRVLRRVLFGEESYLLSLECLLF